eukprot:321605_1
MAVVVDNITFMFIKDDFSKLCEPVQNVPFLYTTKQPVIGQRTETAAEVPDAGWCRFSGIITHIHAPPTEAELKELSKPWINFMCPCGKPFPNCDCDFSVGFGAPHGQRVTGRGILNFDFYDKMKGVVNEDQVYEIEYQMDSNQSFVWIVVAAKRLDVEANGFRDLIWPQNGCVDCIVPNQFKKGDKVVVKGLKSKQNWNGKTAEIIGAFSKSKQRWPVALELMKNNEKMIQKVLIKIENLSLCQQQEMNGKNEKDESLCKKKK